MPSRLRSARAWIPARLDRLRDRSRDWSWLSSFRPDVGLKKSPTRRRRGSGASLFGCTCRLTFPRIAFINCVWRCNSSAIYHFLDALSASTSARTERRIFCPEIFANAWIMRNDMGSDNKSNGEEIFAAFGGLLPS